MSLYGKTGEYVETNSTPKGIAPLDMHVEQAKIDCDCYDDNKEYCDCICHETFEEIMWNDMEDDAEMEEKKLQKEADIFTPTRAELLEEKLLAMDEEEKTEEFKAQVREYERIQAMKREPPTEEEMKKFYQEVVLKDWETEQLAREKMETDVRLWVHDHPETTQIHGDDPLEKQHAQYRKEHHELTFQARVQEETKERKQKLLEARSYRQQKTKARHALGPNKAQRFLKKREEARKTHKVIQRQKAEIKQQKLKALFRRGLPARLGPKATTQVKAKAQAKTPITQVVARVKALVQTLKLKGDKSVTDAAMEIKKSMFGEKKIHIRDRGYQEIQDKKLMQKAFVKTTMCKSVKKGVPCRHGKKCRFAHSRAELTIRDCRFGEHCRFKDTCHFRHKGETDEAYYQRVTKTGQVVKTGEHKAEVKTKSEVKTKVVKTKVVKVQPPVQLPPPQRATPQRVTPKRTPTYKAPLAPWAKLAPPPQKASRRKSRWGPPRTTRWSPPLEEKKPVRVFYVPGRMVPQIILMAQKIGLKKYQIKTTD